MIVTKILEFLPGVSNSLVKISRVNENSGQFENNLSLKQKIMETKTISLENSIWRIILTKFREKYMLCKKAKLVLIGHFRQACTNCTKISISQWVNLTKDLDGSCRVKSVNSLEKGNCVYMDRNRINTASLFSVGYYQEKSIILCKLHSLE